MKNHTVCFFGHRNIHESNELQKRLYDVIEQLIAEEHVDTFLFGSKSRFNDLCLEAVTIIKEKYPHIKRVYVRAEFPFIDEQYKNYLLEQYEDSYFPENILHVGKAVYIGRNCEMIRQSQFFIVYYDEQNTPVSRKSGTKIALDYAVKCNKTIIRLP